MASQQTLRNGEVIELQSKCDYCGEGAMAIVNTGVITLTNQRVIIIKSPMLANFTGRAIGGVSGALVAGAFGRQDGLRGKLIADFPTSDIESVEDGRRGVRKMLVINLRDGSLYKIAVKKKKDWREALMEARDYSRK